MGFVVNGAAPKYISVGVVMAPLSVMCYDCYISPLESALVRTELHPGTTWGSNSDAARMRA